MWATSLGRGKLEDEGEFFSSNQFVSDSGLIMATSFRAASLEFLATLLLVFTGCGATVAASKTSGDPTLQTALAWGFAYATLLQLFSAVVGVHMNPAVSLALLVTRKISPQDFCLRVAVQGACGAMVWGAFE
jgi:glycerol uptake facilitator-like aquaporin